MLGLRNLDADLFELNIVFIMNKNDINSVYYE